MSPAPPIPRAPARRRRLAGAVLALFALGGLAACGGDERGASGSASGSASATSNGAAPGTPAPSAEPHAAGADAGPLPPALSGPALVEPAAPALRATRQVEEGAPPAEVSLDGDWEVIRDPDGSPATAVPVGGAGRPPDPVRPDHPAWDEALVVPVPGPFEVHPGLAGVDGVVWYRRALPAAAADEGEVLRLRFDGANQRADVWLDGEWLGRHDGADAPFGFDVTGRLDRPGKLLVVRVVDPGHEPVDGLRLGALPHAKESWYYNHGGLTGGVRLRRAPAVEVTRSGLALRGEGADEQVVVWAELWNHGDAPRGVRLEMRLTPAGDAGPDVIIGGAEVAPAGATRVERPVPQGELTGLARWSPDLPTRHRLALVLTAAPGAGGPGERTPPAVTPGDEPVLGRWNQPVGLRRFEVRGGHFALNGGPLYLRGVLFQPYWPGTLTAPPDEAFLRRELQAIKDAGFNLVRAHIRDMPEIYAACDEIGLLVHAEPTLGWITAWDEHTLPLTDRMLTALSGDVDAHPSVVMIGLLNELSGLMTRHAGDLMRRMRQRLPDHLLLEDSGSWEGRSHWMNPGSDVPVPFDDLHVYRAWPWDDGDRRHVESLGAEHDGLVFVSEYGYGGIPSFEANLAGFGEALHLEDARVHAAQLADVRAAFAGSAPLRRLVPDVDALVALGQRNQAVAADFMARALRAHPRVAGDVYTQWRDVAWEDGAGLADVWGNPKPVLEAFAALNAAGPARPDDPRPASPWDEPDLEAAMFGSGLHGTFHGELLGVSDDVRTLLEPLMSVAPGGEGGPPHLIVTGVRNHMWSAENIDTTVSLLRWVRQGGTLLLLDPPRAGKPMEADMFGYDQYGVVTDLPVDLRVRAARGHFVGTHLVFAADTPLTQGLGGGDGGPRLFGRSLASLRPHQALLAPGDDDVRLELAVFDGYGLLLGGIVQVVPYGEGHLVLNTLPFEGDIADDFIARGMLANLVETALRVARDKPRPPGRPWVSMPDETATEIGRLLWRHRIYFGLAERLAWQVFNGVRPVRRDPDDLEPLVARKNAALDRIVQGDHDGGLEILAGIDSGPLAGDRDVFLRAEMRLAQEFREHGWTAPLPDRLVVGRLHARALWTLRDGDLDGALALLDEAAEHVARLAAAADG